MASSAGKNRTTAQKGVVVWEWFNEYGKWRPYSPEIVAFIDKEGQTKTQVCLGTVSAALKMYTIDIPSMCQIRKGTGTSRPVRRIIHPAGSPPAQQVMWEFEGDQPGQWVAYDMEISACLEQALQTGQQMLDMNALFQLPYSVHFTTMQQVRMNTGRTRKIRRSTLQTPYPPANKSPKCFSKLTTVLPDTSLASASGGLNQPSTSGSNGSANSSVAAAAPAASGSGTSRVMKAAGSLSSSDTDSDSDTSSGMTLRLRTRQKKSLKRTHSQSSMGGKKSSKLSYSATSANTTGTVSSVASTSNSGLPSQSCVSQQNHTSVSSASQLSSSSYPMPTVSLVSTGPTLPLSLVTYAQPLGANLTRGFPPMTHLPPSQQSTHSHHPATQSQGHSHSAPAQAPSATHSSAQSTLSNSLPHPQNSHPSSQSQRLAHCLQQGPSGSASHMPSTSQAPMPAQTFSNHKPTIPPSTNSSWPGLSRRMATSSSHPMTSHSMNMMSTSQPGSSTPSSQSGSGSSYQGPLTRNRLLKQQVFGPGVTDPLGGRGMGSTVGSVSGTMNNILMSGMPQNFSSAQHQGLGAVGGGLAHPHHQPQPPQNMPSQQPGLSTHGQHIQQLRQHFQQLQQQQQQLSGIGLGSGYPFNQSSFAPTMGLNVLPGSALLLPGSGGSGQHGIPSTPGTVSNSQRRQPAPSLPVTETLPTDAKIVLPKKKKTKTKPKSAEEVLNKYMENIPPPENEDCCICFDALTAPSSYGEGKAGQSEVIQLNKCSHMFHRLCLLAMYDSSHNGDSLQCPTCKTIYGELIGNCPPGEMSYDILSRPLPGHPHCSTIRVTYYISPGIQGPEHPHPGQRFTARGFPRAGFLPDDNRGRKILKLLMVAFQRKLMFTIGTSATTGESDTVTWNEIHHKTEFGSNVSGHGYPDPNYLDNVTAELALKGVTEQDV